MFFLCFPFFSFLLPFSFLSFPLLSFLFLSFPFLLSFLFSFLCIFLSSFLSFFLSFFNPLPDDKILHCSELKQIADDILILSQTSPCFYVGYLQYKYFENTVGKGEIAHNEHFPFSHSVFYPIGQFSTIFLQI